MYPEVGKSYHSPRSDLIIKVLSLIEISPSRVRMTYCLTSKYFNSLYLIENKDIELSNIQHWKEGECEVKLYQGSSKRLLQI